MTVAQQPFTAGLDSAASPQVRGTKAEQEANALRAKITATHEKISKLMARKGGASPPTASSSPTSPELRLQRRESVIYIPGQGVLLPVVPLTCTSHIPLRVVL